MPDYSDQIPPRDNKTLAIALAAAAAVILVLVIGVLFNTHNGEQATSVNQPLFQGELNMQKTEKIDVTKLLGFETVTRETTDGIDFQDETLSAKLSAKVGSIEAVEPEGR